MPFNGTNRSKDVREGIHIPQWRFRPKAATRTTVGRRLRQGNHLPHTAPQRLFFRLANRFRALRFPRQQRRGECPTQLCTQLCRRRRHLIRCALRHLEMLLSGLRIFISCRLVPELSRTIKRFRLTWIVRVHSACLQWCIRQTASHCDASKIYRVKSFGDPR